MTEEKMVWLKSQALSCLDGIVDCDPSTSMVTYEDGTKRQITERYTRVMGYHRPVSAYNLGKQAEHKDRTYFKESKAA